VSTDRIANLSATFDERLTRRAIDDIRSAEIRATTAYLLLPSEHPLTDRTRAVALELRAILAALGEP